MLKLDHPQVNLMTYDGKRLPFADNKFDVVLIVDYVTIKYTKGILNSKKILVISEKYTEKENFFFDKSLYPVIYYGEMPFHYKDVKP